jgi:hypothetical protein
LKPEHVRLRRQRLTDMTRADDQQLRRRIDRLGVSLGQPIERVTQGDRRGRSTPHRIERIPIRLRIGGVRERLNIDVHRPAADQAVVPAVVVVELEGEQLGRPREQNLDRLHAHLGLDAPAAERSDRLSIGQQQHPRPSRLRRAPPSRDDRAQRHGLPRIRTANELFQNAIHDRYRIARGPTNLPSPPAYQRFRCPRPTCFGGNLTAHRPRILLS